MGQGMEDMTKRAISRSGGLLEVIESAPVEINAALASGNCETVALGKQVAIDFDTASEEASKEDSRSKNLFLAHRV